MQALLSASAQICRNGFGRAACDASVRSLSSSAAMVDQMLQYVRQDLQGQGQAAIDVLRSGLSMQQDPAAGYDSGRLHLALSEAFTAEHDWAQAAAAASAAASAFTAATTQDPAAATAALSGLSGLQACRALLAGSRDDEAAAAAATAAAAAGARSSAAPGSLLLLGQQTQQLLVTHATTAAAPAAAVAEGLAALQQTLADQPQQQQQQQSVAGGVLLALGHKVAGDAAWALGEQDAAAASYAAAKEACDSSSSSSGSGGSSVCGVSVRLLQEVAADVTMAHAQVLMSSKQWDKAEEVLGDALKAAEAAAASSSSSSVGSSALLAPVLLLLSTGYCRSARVMLAEGLLREAAKLGSDPHRLVEGPSSHQPCHPTLKAAVCWRYCQLLTALPNREAEAASWGLAARKLWECAGQGFAGAQLQDVLGDEVALKGQGQHGRGAVVSLLTRRLLPVYK